MIDQKKLDEMGEFIDSFHGEKTPEYYAGYSAGYSRAMHQRVSKTAIKRVLEFIPANDEVRKKLEKELKL